MSMDIPVSDYPDWLRQSEDENVCPECGALLNNPYKGEWVCPDCGYTEIEHTERPY